MTNNGNKNNQQKKRNNSYHNQTDDIFIKGARVHNLKNVTVTIPRNKLVVVTGVSGSGKSSLPSILYLQKGSAGMQKA